MAQAGQQTEHGSRRCHADHRGTILPYLERGRGSFQGEHGSFQKGTTLALPWVQLGSPGDPHPPSSSARPVHHTLGTFSNGSPASILDWSQCFSSSRLTRASSRGHVPQQPVAFTAARREGRAAGAFLENFSGQMLPKNVPKSLVAVEVAKVQPKASRNAPAPHGSATSEQATAQRGANASARPVICC